MRSQALLASGALAALALASCQQNTNNTAASPQPLAAPTQAELQPAPAPTALPAAPAAPVRYAPPQRRYRYIDDAYAMSQAYADAPPDYAFDYNGYAPQAWGSRDGVVRVGERVPGGWRYYYYRPGSDAPYLVRDPEYAYGYDGGQLVVVYDSRGRALDPDYAQRQAWLAGRYLARAHDLWQAARDNQRREVETQVWRSQQAEQARERQYWAQTQQADPDWRGWRDQHQDEDRSRWVQTAAAWAAMQAASPPPPNGGRRDAVWAERETWRQRVAQQQPQGQGFAPQPQAQPQPQPGPAGNGQGWPTRNGQNRFGQEPPPAEQPGRPQPQPQAGFQAQQQAQAERQQRLQAQQQVEADRQRQLQAQQQAAADRQHQLQAQQQAAADRQHQLQAQQQAAAERQHQLQAQQQAAAAAKARQAGATPPPGRPAWALDQQQRRAAAAQHPQGAAPNPQEHHPASSHPPR